MKFFVLIGFMLIALVTLSQSDEVSMNLSVRTIGGTSVNIVSQKAPSVLIFLSPDCPISQKYMSKIEDIKTEYNDYKVRFFGVVPGNISVDEIKTFAREYNSSLIFLTDPKLKLVKTFDAQVTPEVFVVDSKGIIQYHGAIDDWFYELGKYRATVTEFYLIDALTSLLGGYEPTPKYKEALGCFIQRKK